jgi:hypothetical protein
MKLITKAIPPKQFNNIKCLLRAVPYRIHSGWAVGMTTVEETGVLPPREYQESARYPLLTVSRTCFLPRVLQQFRRPPTRSVSPAAFEHACRTQSDLRSHESPERGAEAAITATSTSRQQRLHNNTCTSKQQYLLLSRLTLVWSSFLLTFHAYLSLRAPCCPGPVRAEEICVDVG